jgi:thiamine biosynthesis lipoprotein
MKRTWLIMGMPVTLVIEDASADTGAFQTIHDYFQRIDDQYSPYKPGSEVSRINDGLPQAVWSREMKTILQLCEQTKQRTKGYFDVFHDGRFDPSGLVKGWAINNAARQLRRLGFKNFYVEAGGDIQVNGRNAEGEPWSIGIRNPFNREEILKVLRIARKGVATSGTYIRGQHIYNPHDDQAIKAVASLTVIGPNIYEADRFATAAFAMGRAGIGFIESLTGFEGYMITTDRQATLTSGFDKYVEAPVA